MHDIRPNYGFASQLEHVERKLFNGKSTLDMSDFKADSILEILEGSGKTKESVVLALRQTGGDAHAALELLLT